MNKNYYYFASALPPLCFDEVPKITSQQFMLEAAENLSGGDLEKMEVLRRYYDLMNLRSYWKGGAFDPIGKFDVAQLTEALTGSDRLPEYVFQFMSDHVSQESRLKNFSKLLSAYFKQEIARSSGFLRNYLRFERELRIIWTGVRAKELSRRLEIELQFEDADDHIVVQVMAQRDAKTFIFPNGYEDLAEVFENNSDEPVRMHKQLCEYRYNKIEQLQDLGEFSLEKIMGYLAQLIVVEKWFHLEQRGWEKVADKILCVAG